MTTDAPTTTARANTFGKTVAQDLAEFIAQGAGPAAQGELSARAAKELLVLALHEGFRQASSAAELIFLAVTLREACDSAIADVMARRAQELMRDLFKEKKQ